MGLLSSNKGRQNFVNIINNHGSKFSLLCYLIGIMWFGLLAHEEFNGGRYFSENQLLPGMINTKFSSSFYIQKVLERLEVDCNNDKTFSIKNILQELQALDLDVFSQDFSIPSLNMSGTNIYGIYRSPRASGVESIVMNVPFNGCQSIPSVAMMIGLAKYFREQTIWAKDIIFLVTEHNVFGISAWLHAYFQEETKRITFGNLEGHGGSIQAAIVLDLPSKRFSHFDILIEGLNGMQPNLDLVHVITRIARLENVPVKLERQNGFNRRPETEYWSSLETLVRSVVNQASGIPSGNHGMFYKYRIEAYTLKGREPGNGQHAVDFESLGRLLEGIFRSINNLLEHIHQSFFMYLLPNKVRYISIGLYMPPLACLLAPLLVSLLQSWIHIFDLNYDCHGIEKEQKKTVSLSVLFNGDIFFRYMTAYISCSILYLAYLHRDEWKKTTQAYITDEMWHDFIIFTASIIVTAVFLRIIAKKCENLELLRFYASLHLAAIIVCSAVMNFSAAFCLSLLFVPVVALMTKSNRLKMGLHYLCCLLATPSVSLFALCLVSTFSLNGNFDWNDVLFNSIKTWNGTIKLLDIYAVIKLWTGFALLWLVLPLLLIVTAGSM